MVGAATGRHLEILDMTGLLKTSPTAKGPTAKALGKNEKQKGAKASTPNYALTPGEVVIDRMTPLKVVFQQLDKTTLAKGGETAGHQHYHVRA
jgi:hypothetical protein